MAQPKYKITEEDYSAAVKYLQNRLADPHRWLERSRIDKDAGQSTESVTQDLRACRTTGELNQWAERYLSTKQWANLKMAIRNSRRRHRGTLIEINDDAFNLLKQEQQHTGKTFSELIITIAEVWEYERGHARELEEEKLSQ